VSVLESLAAVLLVLGSLLVLWAVAKADRIPEPESAPGRPDAAAKPLRPAA
jgi:hypothetical protein